MRSAQRRTRIEKSKGRIKKYSILIKILIPIVLIGSFFIYLRLTTLYWDGSNKVSFVFQKPSGDVAVTVLDPLLSEETTITIPGDTECTVARNYGSLRIKNVWQLGLNEKLGGKLLAETVTNNFLFPTMLWSQIDMSDNWKFVFAPGLTNIPFGDRIAMTLFSLRVKSIDKTQIDLGKNQFLKKQILTDGQTGYVMNGNVSGRLTVYFSDNSFADTAGSGKSLRFALVDSTETTGIVNGVGSILEILGAKVVSVDRETVSQDLDCEVFGKNKDAVRKIATLFSCKLTSDTSDFDMVMRMGIKFAKRF